MTVVNYCWSPVKIQHLDSDLLRMNDMGKNINITNNCDTIGAKIDHVGI